MGLCMKKTSTVKLHFHAGNTTLVQTQLFPGCHGREEPSLGRGRRGGVLAAPDLSRHPLSGSRFPSLFPRSLCSDTIPITPQASGSVQLVSTREPTIGVVGLFC